MYDKEQRAENWALGNIHYF